MSSGPVESQVADEVLSRPLPVRPVGQRVREWTEWFGVARLVVVAVSVVAVGAGGFWLLRTPPAPAEASLPLASRSGSSPELASVATSSVTAVTAVTTAAETTMAVPVEAVVHVAGAVMNPGVYRLAAGSRVVDAVLAAGGLQADANSDAVNLAQVLRDGDRIYLPHAGEPVSIPYGVTVSPGGAGAGTGSTAAGSATGPIDLNRATAEQLDLLPGVGPSTAAAIISYRDQHGPFSTVDDLSNVRGIGPAKLDALRTLVVV